MLCWKACDGFLARFPGLVWSSQHVPARSNGTVDASTNTRRTRAHIYLCSTCQAQVPVLPGRSRINQFTIQGFKLFPFPSVGAHLIVNTCRPRAGIHKGVRNTQDTVVLKTDPVAQQGLVPGDCQIVDSPMGQNWDTAAMASLLRRRLRHHDFDSDPPYVNVPEVDCASAARTEGMVTNQA